MSPRRRRTDTGHTPLVLVVDDDPIARSVVAGVLRDSDIRTIEADSGTAALEMLAEWSVDAALVDQNMPGMSGLELTRRIRRLPTHQLLPILFLSADESVETRVAALRAGATDFIAKPTPFDELVARLESQISLSSRWAGAVRGLEARAATVVDLAALGSEANPAVMARMICERVSRAHGGVAVAIYSLVEGTGSPSPIAACGDRIELWSDPGALIRLRGETVPWVEYLAEWSGGASRPVWVACFPLRLRHGTTGVLTIDGGAERREEVLAAGLDYAQTVSLLLDPALTESRRASESRDLVERILNGQAFQPVFQPIVDISTGRAIGYEALTRLTNGNPVVELLAEATEAGMRADAEMDLLGAALREANRLDDAWVSVNLSPSVVVERSRQLADLIEQSGCRVVIELTENERIEDYAAVGQALAGLGREVRLSVDDAGSGYASLRHVIALHPHYLKLDRSWISGLDQDETRQALVAGIVAFCQHTATEMIAEGVETESELDALRRLDVRLAQGYLLGRPEPLGHAGHATGARS
jgi:EAL domain-containing protein (putative c-di-GMP-specific phosphodiesterase class I)/CheY-like chemotaxis protein